MTRQRFIDAIELGVTLGAVFLLFFFWVTHAHGQVVHCGTERWPVKTLGDSDKGNIRPTVHKVSVTDLTNFAAPTRADMNQHANSRYPEELQRYRVTATLIGFKKEADQDFHIVIADPAAPKTTMVVEVPASQCVSDPDLGKSMDAIRKQFTAKEGTATAAFKHVAPVKVTIEGVGFFDFIHGQTGVARNGFELHPATSISFGGTP